MEPMKGRLDFPFPAMSADLGCDRRAADQRGDRQGARDRRRLPAAQRRRHRPGADPHLRQPDPAGDRPAAGHRHRRARPAGRRRHARAVDGRGGRRTRGGHREQGQGQQADPDRGRRRSRGRRASHEQGPPGRAAARRRGGLAARVRGDPAPGRAAAPSTATTHTVSQRAADHRAVPARRPGPHRAGHRPAGALVLPPARVAEEGRAGQRHLPAQQPVHVPVDGEAQRLLRAGPAGPQGPADHAGAVQEPGRQRALGLHLGEVQPRRSTSTRSPRSSATRST